MAKAKDVLGSVIGMVTGKTGGGTSSVDLVGAIVESVKRLAADSDFIKTAVEALKAAGVKIPEEKAEAEAEAAETRKEAESAEPKLSWCYGGFDGSKAEISEDAVLASASLKGDTLTFAWDKGDCRNLGATSKTDADHTVACLFLEDGAGGKFEWISTSRKTRSVKNIKDGYNKWPKTALDAGGKLWFCIAGSDGKRRTACVEVERK